MSDLEHLANALGNLKRRAPEQYDSLLKSLSVARWTEIAAADQAAACMKAQVLLSALPKEDGTKASDSDAADGAQTMLAERFDAMGAKRNREMQAKRNAD